MKTAATDEPASPACPLCGEPLGRGRWHGGPPRMQGEVPEALLDGGESFELCPYCRLLGYGELPARPSADAAPEGCVLCGAGVREIGILDPSVQLDIEETMAVVRGNPGAIGLWCAACRALRLPEASLELHGLEVALQRDTTRRRIGRWLWRGFQWGAGAGAVVVVVLWPWEGMLGFLARATAGALLGAFAGSVAAGLGAFLWALARREHRDPLDRSSTGRPGARGPGAGGRRDREGRDRRV